MTREFYSIKTVQRKRCHFGIILCRVASAIGYSMEYNLYNLFYYSYYRYHYFYNEVPNVINKEFYDFLLQQKPVSNIRQCDRAR